MANNHLMNMMGEIIGVADVVGGDFPASPPVSLVIPLISGPGSTYTAPSSTPTGQNGASVLQLGNASSNEIYSKNTEFWSGCPGIISLPALPVSANATDACQVMYMNRNNQNIGFAYRDTRYTLNAGNLLPGETMIFAPGSSAKLKVGLDNSITIGCDSDAGQRQYLQINPKGLYFNSPWGTISLDANGFNVTTASGASFTMGGLLSSAIPIPSLTSFVNINAGTFNAQCTAVSLGAGPIYAQAVVPLSPVAPPLTPLPMFATCASPGVCISLT